jgi:hypothetical protein
MAEKIHIIDDSTPDSFFDQIPDDQSTGYKGMFRSQQSAEELTTPFPKELLIPRSDWQGWIEEMKERQSRLWDLITRSGIRCKNQGKTNFCWANAPVWLLMLWRLVQNQAPVNLSPASVACRINGFKNNGGWGEDALRFLIASGAVPSAYWPDNAIDRKYNTAENQKIAKSYRVDGWFILRPRSEEEQISCLLRRMPCAVGLNYWGHEVSDIGVDWINGQVAVEYINSWGFDWPTSGANGRSFRQGKRILADDIVTIRSGTAS